MDGTTLITFISNVVVAPKIERWSGFARSARNRNKFLSALFHFPDFDPAVIVDAPQAVDTAAGVLVELQRRGAGNTCWIASVDGDIDDRSLLLADAIEQVFGYIEGTLLICNPRLAYYEGESPKNHFILHRR